MRLKTIMPFYVVVLCLTAGSLYAGSAYNVSCTTAKCGFSARILIGGGFAFGQVTGYCSKCQKPVGFRFDPAEKPEPTLEFWDPVTGSTRHVFECPDCERPFVEIRRIEDCKYCPKCGKDSLRHKHDVNYD